MEKCKEILKEHFVHIILLIIATIFVISPVLLRIPPFDEMVTFFLDPLKTRGLESSYVETIGALLGTFLAITGALWTQRKIDSKNMKKENRTNLIVVYYDFKFAYGDLRRIFGNMITEKNSDSGKTYEFEIDKTKVKERLAKQGVENLFIDNDWIKNVASLNGLFDDDQLEQIFKMYGEIDTIKTIMEEDKVEHNRLRISKILNEIFKVERDDENGNKIVLSREYREIIDEIQKKIEDLSDVAIPNTSASVHKHMQEK